MSTTPLLIAYSLTNLAQVLIEEAKNTTGMTDEQIQAEWETMHAKFSSSLALWQQAEGKDA